MSWETVLAFNVVLFAAIASPGPSLLFLTRTALAQGRLVALRAALGLGLMAALWTLAALLGLDAIFRAFPWAYVALKTAGALYLLWIAFATWRSARDPIAEGDATAGRRAFWTGMLVNLGNPKSVLFAGSVLVVIFPPGLTGAEKALIFFNHLAVEWVLQPLLAVCLTTRPVRQAYLSAKPALDRGAACILGLLGLRLLTDRP